MAKNLGTSRLLLRSYKLHKVQENHEIQRENKWGERHRPKLFLRPHAIQTSFVYQGMILDGGQQKKPSHCPFLRAHWVLHFRWRYISPLSPIIISTSPVVPTPFCCEVVHFKFSTAESSSLMTHRLACPALRSGPFSSIRLALHDNIRYRDLLGNTGPWLTAEPWQMVFLILADSFVASWVYLKLCNPTQSRIWRQIGDWHTGTRTLSGPAWISWAWAGPAGSWIGSLSWSQSLLHGVHVIIRLGSRSNYMKLSACHPNHL